MHTNPKSPRGRQNSVCSITLLSSLTGLEGVLVDHFPSVKTLGYFQETQALNMYAKRLRL